MSQDRRLIELSIPLDAISAQSAREKSIRYGHIFMLHIMGRSGTLTVR